jgi:CheY-like chemotaxis protein
VQSCLAVRPALVANAEAVPEERGALTCLCPANHYELILLDMHMPAISGLDIMHYLRDREDARCVPVIAISGRMSGVKRLR